MKVYITFGQIHTHSINGKTFDEDSIAEIECQDYNEGRTKAWDLFSDNWHQCLEEAELTPELLSYFPRGIIPVENKITGEES